MSDPSPTHPTSRQLEVGWPSLRHAPKDRGALVMIVRRPRTDEREVLSDGVLDLVAGLVGDNWQTRGSSKTQDGAAHPEMQLNIMSSRVAALVAGNQDRWALAGDQLYVDLDLSSDNLPPGTRLEIGEAMVEVTAMPHTGCKKFRARFGIEALRFVNSAQGKRANLRGINAKVVRSGKIRRGDLAIKVGA